MKRNSDIPTTSAATSAAPEAEGERATRSMGVGETTAVGVGEERAVEVEQSNFIRDGQNKGLSNPTPGIKGNGDHGSPFCVVQ